MIFTPSSKGSLSQSRTPTGTGFNSRLGKSGARRVLQASDMLDHAARLVTTPAATDADLRRAVSASYYAAFHLICAAVAAQACPPTPNGLRGRFQRGLEHGVMKISMEPFRSSKSLASHTSKLNVSSAFSPDVAEVAELFGELQDARQVADYDFADAGGTVGLSWASDCVGKARRLFAAWDRAKTTEEAKLFLASLIFGNKWAK
jgi:hypothetical protein